MEDINSTRRAKMTSSVACKTEYVAPPSGQFLTDPASLVSVQSGYEHGQEVTSNLTEIEYTHLQHLINGNVDFQAADHGREVKLNPSSYNTCKTCPSSHVSLACQPKTLTPLYLEPQCLVLNNEHTENGQEIMLVYDNPTGSMNNGEKTPIRCGEVPIPVLAKVKGALEVKKDRACHRKRPQGSRPNPPARVCLEKKFNCGSADATKQQDAAVLNIFLSLLHQSTDTSGSVLSPEKHLKTEQGAPANHVTEKNPLYPSGPATSQDLFSQIIESKKQPEVIIHKNLSYSYIADQTTDSGLKSFCMTHTGRVDKQQIVNDETKVVENPRKRVRMHSSQALQVIDVNAIQGSENHRPENNAFKPGRSLALENSERRERHNSKERDRRRRIRLCHDELNLLVPFCNSQTDKVTTLQWTTAFLKYIKEVHGDSIKQEFQSAFCEKTGVWLKPSYAKVAPGYKTSPSLY